MSINERLYIRTTETNANFKLNNITSTEDTTKNFSVSFEVHNYSIILSGFAEVLSTKLKSGSNKWYEFI